MRKLLLSLAAVSALSGLAQEVFVKEVVFPANATPEQKIEMASRLVPSAKQLEWQKLDLTAFLHFGMNTFTNREWGDGKESPKLFNPQNLDTDQWVKALKDAGFKMVILTAKHHDGFCLWPTATTSHSVASSDWRGGKGDVVRDLRKSCDKYGMKMGVYLSPWDRNASCYGDSPKYNDMFVAQLTELLSNYGKMDEVWFDGACGEGPNGKKQVYDWARFKETIERLQPEAVVAIMGDDVRWVGNERGMGRETEWSATAITPGILPHAEQSNKELGLQEMSKDLGGRDIVAKAKRLYWWPSEVDVSMHPGWFWHKQEQPKTLRELAEIYLTSVGRNSVLLLNIPPNTDGLISDYDVERLKELRNWIDTNFSNNLVTGRNGNAVGIKNGALPNTVLLGEDLSKGQHVEAFDVEARVKGKWQKVTEGTTIGKTRILMFPEVKADSLRVVINSCRGKDYVNKFEAYNVVLPTVTNVTLPAYKSMDTKGWKAVKATGSLKDIAKAYDGNDSTYWQSKNMKRGPWSMTIDLGQKASLAGFKYTPRKGDDKSGTIFHYKFETSKDGKTWTVAPTTGEFSNIVNNPIPQIVYFPSPIEARYVRLVATDEIESRPFITVGDFSVLIPR